MDGINYSRNHFLVVTCRIDDDKKPYHKLNIKMNFVEETSLSFFLLLYSAYKYIVDRLLLPPIFNYFLINFFLTVPQTNYTSNFPDCNFKIVHVNEA